MTNRDCILLTSTLRSQIPSPESYSLAEYQARSNQYVKIVLALCDALSKENHRFNRAEFLDACSIPQD